MQLRVLRHCNLIEVDPHKIGTTLIGVRPLLQLVLPLPRILPLIEGGLLNIPYEYKEF